MGQVQSSLAGHEELATDGGFGIKKNDTKSRTGAHFGCTEPGRTTADDGNLYWFLQNCRLRRKDRHGKEGILPLEGKGWIQMWTVTLRSSRLKANARRNRRRWPPFLRRKVYDAYQRWHCFVERFLQ